MTLRTVLLALVSLSAFGSACGGKPRDDRPVVSERPAVVPAADTAPASKRLLGRWTLNLQLTPDIALTSDLRKIKRSGEKLRIEYDITDTKISVHTWRGGAESFDEWNYEIAKEDRDKLVLRRPDPSGKPMEIEVTFLGPHLAMGVGSGRTYLDRIP